nr:hypothetical protein RKHAN_02281 [Rhizobium sp. Khangiran2]
MSALVRHFIIVTLICVNFAILFGAMVGNAGSWARRSDLGFAGRCTGLSPFCGALL